MQIKLTNKGARYLNDMICGRGWTSKAGEIIAAGSLNQRLELVIDAAPKSPIFGENIANNTNATKAHEVEVAAWEKATCEFDLGDKEYQAGLTATKFFLEAKAIPGDLHFAKLLQELKLGE